MNKWLLAICLLTFSSLPCRQAGAQAQTPVKKVLMEEFTTVLCGVCPPATYAINQFHAATPNTILITHHEGFGRDSMSNPITQAIYTAFKPSWGSFAPAIMIERTVYPSLDSLIPYLSTFSSGYDTLVGNALLEPPVVDIQISSQYNFGTGSLLSTVTATFIDPLPAADYRVNLFLVEDSVSGVGYPGYAQKCYDANFVAQHYPGYPYANDTISGYPHRYVMRNTLAGNPFGTAQTVPVLASNQSPSLNSPYVFTMTNPFVIPSGYNFGRLYLAAAVSRYQAGAPSGNQIINAQIVKLSENISTGLNTSDIAGGFGVIQNPFVSELEMFYGTHMQGTITYEIFDIAGKSVLNKQHQTDGSGSYIISTDALSSGTYFISASNGDFRKVFKIVKAGN